MSTTKIMMFTDQAEAEAKYAFHRAINGNSVILIGPSDVIRTAGDAPSKIEWDSGAGVDWYMLVVTRERVWADGDNVSSGPP